MNSPDKPTIPQVVARFAAYYEKPGNGVWGALHSVLDHSNVANIDVQHCLVDAEARGDLEGLELARILLAMSRTQRLKLPDAVDAFITARLVAEDR